MLILGQSREELLSLLQQIQAHLEMYGLELNQEKTICSHIDIGADFLGYYFDKSGKSIPAKAEAKYESFVELVGCKRA